MEWLAAYQLLSAREREEFARLANRLLATTFLLRRGEDRRDYHFLERHREAFAGYLAAMGWEMVLDPVHGVAQAVNRQGGTRLALGLWDSILLLVLRLLYEEKRKQLNLGEDVMARIQEVHDKCLALKLRERGVVEKKYLREAFALFKRFSLAEVLDGDITRPETRFLIYPSVLFAVRAEAMAELHRRLEDLRAGEGEEDDEAPDRDQAG